MNNTRRRQIRKVVEQIKSQIEELQTLQEEEQEYFDNMPENLQYSERGEKAELDADDLQNIIDELDSQLDEIENIL